MKKHSLALSVSVVAILIQSTHAQQSIPDEINYKPYQQNYLAAKSVSDKKRNEADKAQNDLTASQKQLQTVVDQLNGNDGQIRSDQDALSQIALTQQSLENQNRTNDAAIRQDQDKVNQNLLITQGLQNQLRQTDFDFDRTNQERARADDNRRNAARDADQWEAKLRAADQELARNQQALRVNQDAIRDANRDKDQAQNQLVRLTQARTSQENAIATAQSQIEPARRQVSDLTPRVEQKVQELAGAHDRQRSAQADVDRDQRELNQITAQNAPLNDKIRQLRSQVGSIQQVLEQQKALFQSTQSDLQNATRNLDAQNRRKDELAGQQRTAEQKRDAAESEFQRVTLERDENQKKLDEAHLKLRGYTRAQQNDPEVIALQKLIADLTATIAQQNQQIQDANTRFQAAKNEIAQIGADLAKTNAEISRLNTLVSQGPAALDSIQNRINSEMAKLAPLARELDDAEMKLAAIAPQQQAAEAALRTSKAALDSATAQVSSLTNEQRSLQSQLKDAQQNLKQAQDSLAQNSSALENTKNDIAQTMRSIETYSSSAAELQKKSGPLEGAVRVSEGNRNKIAKDFEIARERVARADDRLRDLNRTLGDIRDVKRRLEQDLQKVNDQSIGLQQEIQNLQAQTQDNLNQLASDRQRAARLNDEIASLNSRNRTLEQSEKSLQAQVQDDQDLFNRLDQLALSAEAATAGKYQDFISRKNRYDQQLADAEKTGADAGRAKGLAEGAPEGRNEGVRLGTQEGLKLGEEQGRAAGLEKGRKAGEDEGLAKGRVDGNTSSEDYERGRKVGLELGRAEAQAEAERVDLPKGRAAQYAKLTAVLPAQSVKIDQETKLITKTSAGGAQHAFLRLVVDGSLVSTLGTAETCTQAFADFKKACLAAYQAAYESSRAEARQTGIDETRGDAKEAARLKAYAAHEGELVKQGYDVTYGPAYQKGLKEGKATAEKRGNADGRSAGFKEVREAAGQSADERGVALANQQFATQPVTLVKSARLVRVGLDGSVGGAVGASDRLKLELTVANYGAKASGTPPVKVELKPLTRNLVVRQGVIALTSIPAATTAVVSNVLTAEVADSATSGSQEQLQVRYTDEEGKVQESLLKVDVIPNLKVSFANIDYDSTPKVGRSQKVTVTVSNDGDLDPTETVTLGLSTQAPASAVRIDEPELEVSRFNSGKRIKVKGLLYTVLDENALRAGITLTVSVKHGARIVAKQDIQIRR